MKREKRVFRVMVLALIVFGFSVKNIYSQTYRDGSQHLYKKGEIIKKRLMSISSSSPPISLILRITKPDLVEKVEELHRQTQDFCVLGVKCVGYSHHFLSKGDIQKGKKYLNLAERFTKIAFGTQQTMFSVLDSAYSSAQWHVVYKAGMEALGIVSGEFGKAGSFAFQCFECGLDFYADENQLSVSEKEKKILVRTILMFIKSYPSLARDLSEIKDPATLVEKTIKKIAKNRGMRTKFLRALERQGLKRIGFKLLERASEKGAPYIAERMIADFSERKDKKKSKNDIFPRFLQRIEKEYEKDKEENQKRQLQELKPVRVENKSTRKEKPFDLEELKRRLRRIPSISSSRKEKPITESSEQFSSFSQRAPRQSFSSSGFSREKRFLPRESETTRSTRFPCDM